MFHFQTQLYIVDDDYVCTLYMYSKVVGTMAFHSRMILLSTQISAFLCRKH
jgi:hypothetical protein